jgi:hypothetical protein
LDRLTSVAGLAVDALAKDVEVRLRYCSTCGR